MESPFDLKFSFAVGHDEQHRVTFEWQQTWGDATAWVDGQIVLKEQHPFGFKRVRRYEFSVGDSERHAVVVEKILRRFGRGLAKQDFRVLVDGHEVGRF